MPDIVLEPVSALGTRGSDAGSIVFERRELRIAEEPALRVFSLRASRKLDVNVPALIESLGFQAPEAPNHFSGDAGRCCAWVEPRAWLVLGAGVTLPAQVQAGAMLTDLSHRYAALRISGAQATSVLAAGLSVMSSPAAPRAGRCARTRFADEAEVFVQQLSETDYRLLIDVGLARFAADWLADAARLTVASSP